MRALFLGLITANLAAWTWAWGIFHDRPALLGTALLAWTFGLRHAVDADHIAAIDNVVRKLMQNGGEPATVGLFFSLGHSAVVLLASLVVAASVSALPSTGMMAIGGTVGTAVSAGFLLLIALVNLITLGGVWRGFRQVARGGTLDPADLEPMLAGSGASAGGVLARLCRPLFRLITSSWQMFPLGFLFGLGFDTATEIGLLGIAAAETARGLSPWHTLVFPALFTVGMALIDTADSALMVRAYGWAFLHPLRKLWYNLTVTAASVLIALLIGGVEALGLVADRLGLRGGVWSVIAGLNDDLADLGFAVVAIFALAWGLSVLIYRWKRHDERAI